MTLSTYDHWRSGRSRFQKGKCSCFIKQYREPSKQPVVGTRKFRDGWRIMVINQEVNSFLGVHDDVEQSGDEIRLHLDQPMLKNCFKSTSLSIEGPFGPRKLQCNQALVPYKKRESLIGLLRSSLYSRHRGFDSIRYCIYGRATGLILCIGSYYALGSAMMIASSSDGISLCSCQTQAKPPSQPPWIGWVCRL